MTIILPILQFAKQLSDDHEGEWAFDDDDSGSVAESFDETKIKRDREGQFAKQEGRSSTNSDALAIADKAPIRDSGPESSGDSKKPRPIDTPEFKRWFGKSKVVGKDGGPLVVYHGTHNDFDEFQRGANFGFHFGTASQAQRALDLHPGDGGNIKPVYLTLKNPLRVTDDEANDPVRLQEKLVNMGLLDTDMVDLTSDTADPTNQRRLINQLESLGFDGLVYANQAEGEGDSWVVFRPEQVKSASGNLGTYDPKSPKINESSTLELSQDGKIRQITTRPLARESQGMTLRQAATGLAQALVRQSAPPEPDHYRDAVVQVARRVSEFCNIPAAVLLQRHIDPEIFQKWRPGPQ